MAALARLRSGAVAFGTACAFLTRLGQGRVVDSAVLSASVCWYPVVGLLLGLLCTAGPWLGVFCVPEGSGALASGGYAWLWAWGYLLLGFWLTRGLHWDGLADVADAWGSGARGPRFWEILRDSRMGAFGAMGLFLACSLLLILAQLHISQHSWWPLVWAPCLGRALCLVLAALTPAHDPHSLGGMACAGASPARALAWTLGLLGLCLWAGGLIPALLLLCGGAAWVASLRFLALAQGGCNGDFLGAAIIGGECLALAALLA